MAEVLFFRSSVNVRAVVDGLEIATYWEWGSRQFHVVIDGHLHPLQFHRSDVADSEARAQHWIRRWWIRDEAIIRAGFAKMAAERLAQQLLERDRPPPAEVARQPLRRPRRRR